MNPLEFHDSKVEEDPEEFIDEVYTMLMIMGVTLVEKEELSLMNLRVLIKFGSTNVKKRGCLHPGCGRHSKTIAGPQANPHPG
uniref:Gag-pol polyprotein n=1 Tax=Solanum tuberosum TaxID=4113 RepID=M1DUJ1_SOLTU